jgi:hypothetical protein
MVGATICRGWAADEPMALTPKRTPGQRDSGEQEIREQEVVRANKELTAYFRGHRTEREARAALKIIKAFIKHRERLDPANRRPLPGSPASSTTVAAETGAARKRPPTRQKGRRRRRDRPLEQATQGSPPSAAGPDSVPPSDKQ